jgi:hypothetical protein
MNLGNLTYATFDEANYLLRQGRASEEEARAYVDFWNNGGKRLTTIELYFTLVSLNGVGCMAPQMRFIRGI